MAGARNTNFDDHKAIRSGFRDNNACGSPIAEIFRSISWIDMMYHFVNHVTTDLFLGYFLYFSRLHLDSTLTHSRNTVKQPLLARSEAYSHRMADSTISR